jgi:quercetin dioxygenase-like cupin family protein
MKEAAAEGFVLGPGEGRSIDFDDPFPISVKATREETSGAFSLLETSEPPGMGTPVHVHRDAAEAIFVIQGEYTVFLANREFVCPAGSFIFIPAGTPHRFTTGSVPSRKLNLYTPAAMVGYFDDLSEATKKGTVDPGLLSEIAGRHSMEVLGPIPDGYL